MPLEKFLESIDSLPCDLRRNFNLIRDLDIKVYKLKKEATKWATDFVLNASKMTIEERKRRFQSIMDNYDRMIQYTEEKKVLAHQSYNMADKHICRLDQDLAIHASESEALDGESDVDDKSDLGKQGTKPPPQKRRKVSVKEELVDDGGPRVRTKDSKVWKVKQELSPKSNRDDPRTHSAPYNYDMDVDPNEPTYCICGKVSFGNMIACDNNDCAIEWFHYQCVNITSTPKGKWYCPDCWRKRATTKYETKEGTTTAAGPSTSTSAGN